MNENVNINGAQQLAVNDAAARRVDLASLIYHAMPLHTDPRESVYKERCTGLDKYEYAKDEPVGANSAGAPDAGRGRMCLELATALFNSDSTGIESRRNDVQARLLAASDSECAQFKQHLNSLQGYGNLVSGSLTTIFAGAGAIVTQVNAARAFGGLGAITSGVRAEFNSDLFLKQAAPTITKAIDQQRTQLRANFATARSSSISNYPLWSAIADAFRYNDQCSLVSGLGFMDRALEVAQSPGLDALEDYLKRLRNIQASADDLRPSAVLRAGAGTAGSGGASSASPDGSGTISVPADTPDWLTQTYRRAVDANYAAERKLASALHSTPNMTVKAACTDADITVGTTPATEAASCLRRATEAKLKQCVGDTLGLIYGNYVDAISAVGSANAAAGAGLAQSQYQRETVAVAIHGKGGWITMLQAISASAFANAQQILSDADKDAALAKEAADKKTILDAAPAKTVQPLKDGVTAVNKITCPA